MIGRLFCLVALLFLIEESTCQRPHIIYPTYRPPPQRPPPIRTVREARDDKPMWIYQGDNIPRAPASGDHPFLPSYIDDVKQDPNRRYARSVDDEPLWLYKGDNIERAPATGDHPYLPSEIDDIHLDPNRRYARSLDSPSAKRGGGSHTTSSGTRNTGATHPGYNRRNTREIRLPQPDIYPVPNYPNPQIPPFFPKPTPLFTPYKRYARDLQIPGMKKPSHRDIIIPNWNPNVRTQPWQRLGVKTRRSV